MIDKSDMFPVFMKKRLVRNSRTTLNRSHRLAVVKQATN
jgi:hypothetical protein